MKRLAPTKKYYLLKGLLLLSFYIVGGLLLITFNIAEEGIFEFEETLTGYIVGFFDCVYLFLFSVANFILVIYAYRNRLNKALKISLLYNAFMISFLPIAVFIHLLFVDHNGESFPIFIVIIYAAVFGSPLGAYLFLLLSGIIFITTICALVKLRRKDNQVAILNVQQKTMIPFPEKHLETMQTIISTIKNNAQLQANMDSSEVETSCDLKFIDESKNELHDKKLFSCNKSSRVIQVIFVYKQDQLDRLEFYYLYQLCHVEQIALG